jgi:hypothetical protein
MATNFYTELNLNGNDLKGLPASPTDATSATSKAYVDSVASGLDPKASVKTASTGAVTLSGVGATVGGVVVAAGDRVLVKNQTPASDNGIYVVKSGVWDRATDATVSGTNPTLTLGAYTFVEGGVNAGKGFVYTSTGWEQFTDTGSLSAGNGVTISGGQISVNPKTGGNILVDGDGVSVTGTLGVAIGGTGTATFATAGFLKSPGGTNAFTTVAGIGIDEVTGRRLVGNYTAAVGTQTQTIDTTSLNSTLRTFASVAVFDSSNNQVFADVQVNSGDVKITTTHNVAGGIALKYLITV